MIERLGWQRILILLLIFAGILMFFSQKFHQVDSSVDETIGQLTAQDRVVKYIKRYQHLPDYYVTKKQARAAGWRPAEGNLCNVLRGKAIGGDIFSNYERRLPDIGQRIWREADVNYQCGHRQTDRLIYSNDGLIYVTQDHYRHFTRLE